MQCFTFQIGGHEKHALELQHQLQEAQDQHETMEFQLLEMEEQNEKVRLDLTTVAMAIVQGLLC